MGLSAGVVAAVSTMEERAEPLAVLLLGPTGSGKTALSLALGEKFNGEIVSCDSVAVYRGMDLGSAKPSVAEQAAAAPSPDRRGRPGPAVYRGGV